MYVCMHDTVCSCFILVNPNKYEAMCEPVNAYLAGANHSSDVSRPLPRHVVEPCATLADREGARAPIWQFTLALCFFMAPCFGWYLLYSLNGPDICILPFAY